MARPPDLVRRIDALDKEADEKLALLATEQHGIVARRQLVAAARVAAELPDAIAVTMDVTDEASVSAGIATVEETLGGIDVVFNNAGIDGIQAPLHEMDAANWHQVSAVNATGVFLVLK
jgi:NAD(P)-dependent dehydrogenase (short-subunit alcohol dehydrogenase family)